MVVKKSTTTTMKSAFLRLILPTTGCMINLSKHCNSLKEVPQGSAIRGGNYECEGPLGYAGGGSGWEKITNM
ncbi:DUF5130 domain-containing protein [Sesbania bispinosa]|nr:DUF5130 domain-containing protein [Sesbania bispinosa]